MLVPNFGEVVAAVIAGAGARFWRGGSDGEKKEFVRKRVCL